LQRRPVLFEAAQDGHKDISIKVDGARTTHATEATS
jgi:hypothetical protein